jgi:hypothetical protein
MILVLIYVLMSVITYTVIQVSLRKARDKHGYAFPAELSPAMLQYGTVMLSLVWPVFWFGFIAFLVATK